ncbi:MAG: hypothetical protein J6U52_09000, partial [Alistipes sp.]|nr:hypothetical protein [Alistipes sp.]
LECTYKNEDGDIVQFVGANIVHKDLREALQGLIPHLALITEQREAYKSTLDKLREQRITDNEDNVYKRLSVSGVAFSADEKKVIITGSRILTTAGVVSVCTPLMDLEAEDEYKYTNDLSLDIEAVTFEAKAYIEEKKWGVKQSELKFEDINPFDAIKAGEVPEAPAEGKTKKRGRKSKAA